MGEQVVNTLHTQTKHKRTKRKKKDESEKRQMQIWGFVSQQRQHTKQPAVSRQHSNPFLNDAWCSKKKHKTPEQKEDKNRTSRSCLQPSVSRKHINQFLHNAWCK